MGKLRGQVGCILHYIAAAAAVQLSVQGEFRYVPSTLWPKRPIHQKPTQDGPAPKSRSRTHHSLTSCVHTIRLDK
ncbi:uncharacterized protein B0H64DRAFT_385024 [Chaetomium fimeti]|uniref:Secreted protein n=1 Tax=Chaetomium fimeti TaxID=1854472 RepID=A0AAE0HMK2_9PEZI|nr:hypothetical protein B0H64DRAFT_385024 [Chaetomium fimeti]